MNYIILYYIILYKFVTQDGDQKIAGTKCTYDIKREFLHLFQKILLMIIRHTACKKKKKKYKHYHSFL